MARGSFGWNKGHDLDRLRAMRARDSRNQGYFVGYSMGRKRVQMSRDHLERQSRCQPLAALVRTWADVFATAKARYEFFREKLELEASGEIGMKYLQSQYPHLMTGKGKRKAADLAITAEREAEQHG